MTPTRWRVALGQALLTVLLFALVGAACGWLWWSLWAPAPDGVVSEGRWFPLSGTQTAAADFAGTGLYVVVAIVAGLALGLLVGLTLDHAEIVTLAAVVVGSALAAGVMLRVGLHLSPPDPDVAATTAADGTPLPGHLVLTGRSPLLAFPVGALLGLAVAFFGVTKATRSRHNSEAKGARAR